MMPLQQLVHQNLISLDTVDQSEKDLMEKLRKSQWNHYRLLIQGILENTPDGWGPMYLPS